MNDFNTKMAGTPAFIRNPDNSLGYQNEFLEVSARWWL